MSVKTEIVTIYLAKQSYHYKKIQPVENYGEQHVGYFLDPKNAENAASGKDAVKFKVSHIPGKKEVDTSNKVEFFDEGRVEEEKAIKIKDEYFRCLESDDEIYPMDNFGQVELISSSKQDLPKKRFNQPFAVKIDEDKIIIVGQRIEIQDLKGE